MGCIEDLLLVLDEAASKAQFPLWDMDEDIGFTGAMRVSGFISPSDVSLSFESIEYDPAEGCIQCMVRCFSTASLKKWIVPGKTIYIPTEKLSDPGTGEFNVGFGRFSFEIKEKQFSIDLAREDLIESGYLESEDQEMTPPALLYKICDTLSKNTLFCEPDFIISSFALSEGTSRLFMLDDWEHPSSEVYENNVNPGSYRDIRSIAKALCEGNVDIQLEGVPNTAWRVQHRLNTQRENGI